MTIKAISKELILFDTRCEKIINPTNEMLFSIRFDGAVSQF